MTFGMRVKTLQTLTADPERLQRAYRRLGHDPDGMSTHAYDAIDDAVRMLTRHAPLTRQNQMVKRAVIVITDGFPVGDTVSPENVIERANAADASIYVVTMPSYSQMMDDRREVIGAFLRFRGHSLNSVNPAELAQAKADALQARQNLKGYKSAPAKADLIAGDVWVAQLWNGDTTQAKAQQPNLGYVLPREGCTIWSDSLVIPRSAPHKRAAHEFMNYILRPEVAAAISNFTGYGSPNAKAQVEVSVPYPSADELARLEYQRDLGENSGLWEQIWNEIRARGKRDFDC